MGETPQRLVERLSDEGRKTVDFFHGLQLDQWDLPVYTEGSCWSARQILAHFISSERAFNLLIEDVLQGGKGAPEGFDIDRFNEREVAGMFQISPQELLSQFKGQRERSAVLVSRMEVADLSRTGRHPFLGQTSLEDIIKLLYRHNQIHQRDIRKSLSSGAVEASE
jgi:hypothetical protein